MTHLRTAEARQALSRAWFRLAVCSLHGHRTRTGSPGPCVRCSTSVARTADERYSECI